MATQDTARPFGQLQLTQDQCAGMRETIKPFADAGGDPKLAIEFCARLYLTLYALEADPDLEAAAFPLNYDEVMLVNNFVSAEDGDWAADVLQQTRQVLYELATGKPAVRLASAEETEQLFNETLVGRKEGAELVADQDQ